MTNDPELLVKLKNLLRWKKSKKFYAEKLNITEQEVIDLIKEIKDEGEVNDGIKFLAKANSGQVHNEVVKKVNVQKGTVESTITSDYEPKDHIE